MRKTRKKTRIDGTDKEILRLLRDANRSLTGRQIARRVNLSSPSIRPRMDNLQLQGIVKPMKIGRNRTIHSNLKVPSKILWGIDFKPEPRRKKRKTRLF